MKWRARECVWVRGIVDVNDCKSGSIGRPWTLRESNGYVFGLEMSTLITILNVRLVCKCERAIEIDFRSAFFLIALQCGRSRRRDCLTRICS